MERFWGRKCAKNGSEAAQIRERRPFWPLNLGAHRIMHEIYPGQDPQGHSHTTLYIPSVIIYTKYTGRRQNDFNVYA